MGLVATTFLRMADTRERDIHLVVEGFSGDDRARLVELLEALRAVLRRQRDDDQGGYSSFGRDGKWHFISSALGGIEPDEMAALFELAGIEPDAIVSKGSCGDCGHAVKKNGRWSERGWEPPCVSCKRPRMSNFVPRKSLVKKK